LSLVESLQQDNALAAIEHIEGLSHPVQRQLQKSFFGSIRRQPSGNLDRSERGAVETVEALFD